MVRLARSVSGEPAGGALRILSNRSGGMVIELHGVVVKAHPTGVDEMALAARLEAVAPLERLVVPPIGPLSEVGDRVVTVWPVGEPVAPDDPDAAPWEEAGALLARLHATPLDQLPDKLPAAGAPARVERAMARMRKSGAAEAAADVERAFAALPAWATGAAPVPGRALVHGDWHLGQLVRGAGGVAGWRLIDVDDLGVGDPAWDLARPAALFAAGTLDPDVWHRFLGAYRAAGGCAVPAGGDPWPALDLPARALAVQLAASGVADAADAGREPDDFERALLDTCRRMISVAGAADVS